MPATFPGPGSAVLELRVNGTCLVRMGGDYTVSASGEGFDFGGAAAGPRSDPIVGTYAVMVYPPDWNFNNNISIHFAANGTVHTSEGQSGTWKVFDPEGMIYSGLIGAHRWSLKLTPGLQPGQHERSFRLGVSGGSLIRSHRGRGAGRTSGAPNSYFSGRRFGGISLFSKSGVSPNHFMGGLTTPPPDAEPGLERRRRGCGRPSP